jgi:YVTN family beta-propeller protein
VTVRLSTGRAGAKTVAWTAQTEPPTIPRSNAKAAAAVRVDAPILTKMFERWRATVLSLSQSSAAISLLESPPSTRRSTSARVRGEYGTVWVTNRTLNNVAAFDAGTGEVVATVPVGSSPTGVVAPLWTGKVYSSDEGSDQVSVISRATRSRLTTIPVGPRPHHMTASTLGDRVYVAEYGRHTVGVIDTATDTKVATLVASPNPAARTHAVWPSRDGRRLYATNEVTNDVAAIDTQTGQLLWNLPVGARPSEILSASTGGPGMSASATSTRSRRSTSPCPA